MALRLRAIQWPRSPRLYIDSLFISSAAIKAKLKTGFVTASLRFVNMQRSCAGRKLPGTRRGVITAPSPIHNFVKMKAG
jgi:hypothetical protein